MTRRHTLGWWLLMGAIVAWFASAVAADTADMLGSVLKSGRPPSLMLGLLIALPSALCALCVAIAPIWLTARYPVTRRRLAIGFVTHLAAAVTIALAYTLARVVQRTPFASVPKDLAPGHALRSAIAIIAVYAVFTALAHAVEYARRYQQKHTAELRLQAELGRAEVERTSAELRMLKMQLNPHFLFNSLNALSLLIPNAPAAAQRMIEGLAYLLRRAMHSVGTQEVTLDEELAGIASFIEVERLRLGGGLTVEWQVAAAARDALVPHMVLQPLVENAIKHGIVPTGRNGTLRIGAAQMGEWVELTVQDDGVGVPAHGQSMVPLADSSGIGSANVRARLKQLYGAHQAFELQAADGGGAIARVRLPRHKEPIALTASVPATLDDSTNGDRPGALALVPPPASETLLRAELALTLAWFGLAWLSGYPLRFREASAHAMHSPEQFALIISGVHAVLLAGVLLATLRLTRARPVSRGRWRWALPAHALLAAAFALALVVEKVLQRQAMGYNDETLLFDSTRIISGSASMYLIYTSLAHVVEYVRRYRWKHGAELRLQIELGRIELERTGTELRMLKMQLNPHFLFNSLSALSLLIPTAPDVAQRMVVGLADLLRRAMHSVGTQEVTLDEELDGLVPLIEIEQLRLGGGLTVEWEVADEARDALIPHMLLRPLVENAITHGLVPNGGRGVLRIAAAREGEWLELAVADTGIGLASRTTAASRADGVGLANLEARLTQLYGTGYSFALRSAGERGTLALVRLPWHEEPFAPSAVRVQAIQ